MNKAELVAQVARESELSKDAAEKAVDATFKNIERALKGGDTVRIVGFGNFQVAQRKASTGRNPRTGAEVQIPASKVPSRLPKAGVVPDRIRPSRRSGKLWANSSAAMPPIEWPST